MNVKTTRFGELDIDEAKVITMPDGMVGFTEKRFFLLTPENTGPFCWLQSVENPDLAFVVVDPLNCVPEYVVKLTSDEYERLGLTAAAETILISVVTMAPNPLDITVNLQGPIVLNPANMTAKQIVLEGNKYNTRHQFFGDAARTALASSRKKKGASPLLDVSSALDKKS